MSDVRDQVSEVLPTGDWRLRTADWRLKTADWRLKIADWCIGYIGCIVYWVYRVDRIIFVLQVIC